MRTRAENVRIINVACELSDDAQLDAVVESIMGDERIGQALRDRIERPIAAAESPPRNVRYTEPDGPPPVPVRYVAPEPAPPSNAYRTSGTPTAYQFPKH